MSMTLEQVRDVLRKAGRYDLYGTDLQACDLADAIDSHLTRPAQSVEVEKVSEALRSARRVAHLYHTGEGMLWYIEKQLETTAALQEKGNG